jgi:hypothetical protein
MRQPEPLIPLGAPGVYYLPERPTAAPVGVPMDECAFVGVAPRGPAWEWVDGNDGPERAQSVAVAVRSWDDYRQLYGGFEGPGLLPLAVSAFFEQGGRVAHVVRVVPASGRPGRRAALSFANGLELAARNEGSWGNRLTAALTFSSTILPVPTTAVLDRQLTTGPAPLAAGAVLRITTDDGAVRIRVVEFSLRRQEDRQWVAMLDSGVLGNIRLVELVEGSLQVVDLDPGLMRQERFDHLGLMPTHPRWLGEEVRRRSRLVEPVGEDVGVVPDAALSAWSASAAGGGADRYTDIGPDDVLGAGVPAAVSVSDVALLCVPDLYSPEPLPARGDVVDPPTVAGAEFAECHPLANGRPPSFASPLGLPGLVPDGIDDIVARQSEVVRLAESARVVALLDVPPGLRVAAVQEWRRRFASSHAAAYHPWLLVPRDGVRGQARLVAMPPSAVAAGIIARTELRWGLPHGPANETAKDVPDLTARIAEPDHGELHWSSVNVFVMEPQGVVLTGARTLSTERMWRQLTARRVVTMVERAVGKALQWAVFEPNDDVTRTVVATTVETLLLDLFRAGAFKGSVPDECFFVRTSAGPALAAEQDGGALLCEIGLAPTEPMEFLLVRVYREGDATVRAESVRG